MGTKDIYNFFHLKHICDVGSSHPPAAVGRKGWTVRPLKWYVSWVQNVDTALVCSNVNLALAYIGEAFLQQ